MPHIFMLNLKYRFKVLEMSCYVICSLQEKVDDRIFSRPMPFCAEGAKRHY